MQFAFLIKIICTMFIKSFYLYMFFLLFAGLKYHFVPIIDSTLKEIGAFFSKHNLLLAAA